MKTTSNIRILKDNFIFKCNAEFYLFNLLDNYGNPESDTTYYDFDSLDNADQGNCYWVLFP